MLVTALAGGCTRRAPSHSPPYRGGHVGTMTRRQEQLKRSRGLSATMLFSLMTLVWMALGPVQWADASLPSSSHGGGCCPPWRRHACDLPFCPELVSFFERHGSNSKSEQHLWSSLLLPASSWRRSLPPCIEQALDGRATDI